MAGFDLTFSPAKSVSVLWALGDEPTRRVILAAHHAAVAQTLGVIERDVARTRTGHAGAAILATRGLIAAGFDHYDSRAGDPQLHTHVTVANRVQGPDGAWRTLYGAELFRAAVAMSATYDALLADHLTRRLDLAWEQRRGRDRNPAHELAAVPDALIGEFSRRAAAITASKDEVIGRFVADHGRAPTRAEAATIRQHATLDTRQAKHTRPLTDYIPEWAARAAAVLGADPRRVRAVLRAPHPPARPASRPADSPTGLPGPRPRHRARDLRDAPPVPGRHRACPVRHRHSPQGGAPDPAEPDGPARGGGRACAAGAVGPAGHRPATAAVAATVVAATEERRSTWSRWNLTAEVMRQIREQGWQFTTPRDLLTVRDRILTTAIGGSVLLNPPDIAHVPGRWRDPSTGRSAFARPETFTSHAVLHAEDRLLAAAGDQSAPLARATSKNAGTGGDHDAVRSEQAAAVEAICGSGRSLDLLVGPAGTGKTATITQLTQRWQAEHGAGSVLALAVSAAAAHVLAEATGPRGHRSDVADLARPRRPNPEPPRRSCIPPCDMETTSKTPPRSTPGITQLSRTYRQWRIRPGSLLVLDEAGMADVHTLDRITAAREAGAKVLLVGDDHQLAAVGPGGTFGMLTNHHPNVAHLSNIRRFRDPDGTPRTWEAAASAQLRLGNPDALSAYHQHDRIRGGDRDTTLQNAYRAWTLDIADGKESLLLAVDNQTVTELNTRAHTDRLAAGHVQPGGLTLADGTTAGVGDWIITRRNDRTLHTATLKPDATTPDAGGFVRNGQHLVITAIQDGAITARTARRPDGGPARRLHRPTRPTRLRRHHPPRPRRHRPDRPRHRRPRGDPGSPLRRPHPRHHQQHCLRHHRTRPTRQRLRPHRSPPDPDTPLHALGRVLATVGAETSAHGGLRELQTTATSRRQVLTEYRQIAEHAQQDRVIGLLDGLGPRYALTRTPGGDLDRDGRYQLFRLVGAIRDGDRYQLDPARALPELARQTGNLDELVGRYETLADTTHHQHRGRPLTRLVDGRDTTATIGITDPTTRRALLDREELLDRLPPDRHQPTRPAASPSYESHHRPAPAPEHHHGIGR